MGNSDDAIERAHYHLSIWKHYRETVTGSISKGYPTANSVISCGWRSRSFDEMADDADFTTARTCDRVIDDLSELHRNAIEAHYLFRGVIKYNRSEDLLEQAQVAFWDKARKWLV